MAVNQGLANLQQDPNFSTQSIQNSINNCNIGFASKTKTLVEKINGSDVLTNTNKSDIEDALNTQSYLYVGRFLVDLDLHTQKLLTGELAQVIQDDVTPTFQDLLNKVTSFLNNVPAYLGKTADQINRGLKGHFGSLSGELDTALENAAEAIKFINSKSLPEDTAYQTAVQNLIDYIDTLADSTAFDESTFNALLSAVESAAGNFDSAISSLDEKTILTETRSQVLEQIQLEVNNLATIVDFELQLNNVVGYLGMADSQEIRNFLIRTSGNADWRSYFENYEQRLSYDNPVFNNQNNDSDNDQTVRTVLRLRGLPDVTDYVDLDSVAGKALRDTRLTTSLQDGGKSAEELITEACRLLGINIAGKDIYGQSKALLENMNSNDVEIVKRELDLYNQVNTLS
jgi:hypothetical protein